MRTPALILLFPFAVFLTETASFMPAMKEACTIVTPKKSSCCMKKMMKPAQCHNKKDTGKKPVENKCTNDPDCTTCPVCYTFIFQPRYEWPAEKFSLTKNYSLLIANYTSFYIPNVWKPPNGLILYSS